MRIETSPAELKGMAKSLGFLTARGGKTSHAAVVARRIARWGFDSLVGQVPCGGSGRMLPSVPDRR